MTSMNQHILNEAMRATAERGSTHGSVEEHFAHVAAMWSAYLGVHVSPVDVPQCLAMLKMSRSKLGNMIEIDHYVDQSGYSSLAGRVAMATAAAEEIQRRVDANANQYAPQEGE